MQSEAGIEDHSGGKALKAQSLRITQTLGITKGEPRYAYAFS